MRSLGPAAIAAASPAGSAIAQMEIEPTGALRADLPKTLAE